MSWNFWRKLKKSKENVTLEQLNEQIMQIVAHISRQSEQIAKSNEQMAELGIQLNKLARLQYKTGQDMQVKLEKLMIGIDDARQHWQAARDAELTQLHAMERQIDSLMMVLINWIDDIDLISARLQDGEQEAWRQLLKKWAGQILTALAGIGVHELEVKGRSFNPQLAESIGTVACSPSAPGASNDGHTRSTVPYQVVEVARRGFVFNDGRLLRKAQVITMREEV
ncbi:nucleotide exchange factor GrpE [Desulfallas sp. Bu1-1]|uniref:nucleotide exchange factor GrpE n=1 Tax=Desulfallas sp. Bu1-1 TaxID=2787620 RepID=UPI00189C950B|nr:nucleotide exchange factor GrpE [Desulfallas sp. Bu1-1]MBF7081459.1 nucleotide exchange factor GrpE [Desulfallas sp. Bu1-1]